MERIKNRLLVFRVYKNDFNIIALSRNKLKYPEKNDIEWRQVDLYSISSTTKALKNVDVGIYLVHSMQPSTRMNQGSFEDTDILLADNFLELLSIVNWNKLFMLAAFYQKMSILCPNI